MVRIYCITLDSADIFPGGVVTGHVLLETSERIKARGVRLSLLGVEKVHIIRRRKDSKGNRKVYHYVAERELVSERVTLFGWPKGAQGDPVFLEAGRQYSFPFKFSIPFHCLPSCEYNESKRISYRIDSCVDRPWRFDYSCKASVWVFPNAHVDFVPPHYSTELEQRHIPKVCFCFGRGALKLRIELVKTAYWWLENIPVEVLVDNSECKSPIRKFKVQLAIVSTYVAKGRVDTHEHQLAVKEFPLSNGEIPPNAQEVKFRHTFDRQQYVYDQRFPSSTIHGEFITHKFVIRATVKYWFGKYSTELPIFIADGPSRPSDSNQPVNDPDAAAAVQKDHDKKPLWANAPPYASGYYPDYPTEDSGLMFDRMPIGKWPDEDIPLFEKTEDYGTSRDDYGH
ncbi:hypothetical protein BSKO_11100 [Bryopsis sp. KO-2023]|nr:hypothetical protein BSKO_11100 [Bryopsis sp. KO-2023]